MSGKNWAAIFPVEGVHPLFVGQPHGDYFVTRSVAPTTSTDLFAGSRSDLPVIPVLDCQFSLGLLDDHERVKGNQQVAGILPSQVPVVDGLPLRLFGSRFAMNFVDAAAELLAHPVHEWTVRVEHVKQQVNRHFVALQLQFDRAFAIHDGGHISESGNGSIHTAQYTGGLE